MANKIALVSDRSPEDFVPRVSRYADNQVIYYTAGEITYITLTTYKRPEFEESPNDKFATITPGTEYRPDLVSQQAYGTVDFWWKILEVNKIKDIYDFKAGKTIRIPNSIY
jgi:hypothetical protein